MTTTDHTQTMRDAVARVICARCEENLDHQGDARGNQYRWQDYLDIADAAIQTVRTYDQLRDLDDLSGRLSVGSGIRKGLLCPKGTPRCTDTLEMFPDET